MLFYFVVAVEKCSGMNNVGVVQRFLKLLLASTLSACLLWIALPASASSITQLTIVGDDSLPGIIGDYSTSSTFSWMSQTFPDNASGFSWTLGPGTSNGVLLGQTQSPGTMTGIRPMFNQSTSFYSTATGITIDSADVIDMSNLLMLHAGTVINVGSGSGFNTLVSRVSDINLLSAGENGWMLNSEGSYYLIYNTRGTCDACNITMHLYGTAVVPAPPALWLLSSGFLGLLSSARRKNNSR